MPLNTESPSTQSCQEFCLALKAARERKRITLAEIASATKIPASLFAALECGDLRRWPKGLFRRSFFREYVRIIGLPAAETCDEFVRLFPDHAAAQGTKAGAAAHGAVPEEDDVRLVLDTAWQGPRASTPSRLFAATMDLGAVALVSAALSRAAGIDGSATTAIIALTYFSVASVLFGETPAKWVIARRRVVVEALTQGPAAIAAAWRRPAVAISQVLGSEGGAPEPVEEPEIPTWITDAHPAGPAHTPRLRVRIKLSQ